MHYTFNKVLTLQEPLLLVALFYILLFTGIVHIKVHFFIKRDPPQKPG